MGKAAKIFIHLENLQSEAFSDGLGTVEPIRFHAVIRTKEEQDEEANVSFAAATEISMDAAVAAVLSQLDGSLKFVAEQGTALKAFLSGKDVSVFLPTIFGKSLEHYSGVLNVSLPCCYC